MHQIYVIRDNIQTNITDIAGNITWKDNIDTLGMQIDFNIPSKYKSYITVGDRIVLMGDFEIFRGIVVKENINKDTVSFNCFDYAFYLNKSKEIYQFNKISADNAIKKILKDFNVPIMYIESMPTLITKIYYSKTISNIIKDLLQQVRNETLKQYILEMRQGKIYIGNREKEIVNAVFNMAANEYNITDFISSPSRSRSVENMRNSIKVVTKHNKNIKTEATARDETLIKKYGLLQEVKSIPNKDAAQAKNIANNLLKDLGKIFEDNSVQLVGNDSVRAGRYIYIEEEYTGMSGKYLIHDCAHNLKNGIHTMQLGLEVI